MKKPAVSIIVPVYKVEQYLYSCVESVLSQSFRDFELLLIDDGSPDKSGEICDEFAKKDERVKVAHITNSGLAAVRNMGLENVSANILAFVDSDDLLATDSLEVMYRELIESGADVILGRVERFDEKDNHRPYTRLNKRTEMTGKEALAQILEGKQLNISMCGGLYRRELFDHLRMPVGYVCEDWYVTPSLYLQAKKVVFIPTLWYLYRENSQSTMANLYRKGNPQVIEVAEHAICVIKDADNVLYYKTLWSNLKRVWKYVGIIYSNKKLDENKKFLSLVQQFLLRYEKDLCMSNRQNYSERIGTWTFCHYPKLCYMLYFLKRFFK